MRKEQYSHALFLLRRIRFSRRMGEEIQRFKCYMNDFYARRKMCPIATS